MQAGHKIKVKTNYLTPQSLPTQISKIVIRKSTDTCLAHVQHVSSACLAHVPPYQLKGKHVFSRYTVHHMTNIMRLKL